MSVTDDRIEGGPPDGGPIVTDGPTAPDPDALYPPIYGPRFGRIMAEHPRVVFLKNLVRSPFTSVGEYTYYDSSADPTGFERNNVLYHYGPERLKIGRFCALAEGTTFMMNASNHRLDGVSTYPFPIFGPPWSDSMDVFADRPSRGDTQVGHDVWFGRGAVVLPGVTIGSGAIIGAHSVVTADVAPFSIVAGNPAQEIRTRFAPTVIARLLEMSWWDWPAEHIRRAIPALLAGSVDDIEKWRPA